MSRLEDLIREIHRRSLWQVLLIYCGAALVAYQAVQALTEGLGLPQWFPALAIVLFIVGLPVVLATAFVREGEPPRPAAAEAQSSIVEAEAAGARHEAGRRRRLLTWRNAGLSFMAALAVWGVVATGWMLFGDRGMDSGTERNMLVVLPFENLGATEDEYFADGLTEEITARLASVSGLGVIGRTSAVRYKNTDKGIKQIGEELGVDYILEGTVRWQRRLEGRGRVRVTPQLVRVSDATHLWASVYEEDLADIFDVQESIARQVASELNVTLLEPERRALAAKLTANLEAYDNYLRGLEFYGGRPGLRLEDVQIAQRMLERAVELDPHFARAYAVLSDLHASAYEFALDRSEERLGQAREAADRALDIDPDLSYGHQVLGYYYYAIRDYDRALEELSIAERGLPGSTWLLHVRGFVQQRQGKWDESLASLERAVALNPRGPSLLTWLGLTYGSLRRYEEAETYFDRALAVQPDYLEAALVKAMIPLYRGGDTGPLRTLIESIPPSFDPWGLVTILHFWVEYLDRDYAAALEVISRSEREYFEWPGGSASKTLTMGMCFAAMDETDRAQAAADLARRDLEARLRERAGDPRLHVSLGLAHNVLGHKAEAIREAQRAVALLPISKDAWEGPDYVRNLANTYASFGEVDAAVKQYELYLSVPANPSYSIKSILLDPAIDPIRDHPSFQALVDKYE